MIINSKKKIDIVKLLDYQVDTYLKEKETLDFYLVKVNQVENIALYTTSMKASFTHTFLCRLPQDVQNEEEIIKALSSKKVELISKKFKTEVGYTSPNSIVISLNVNPEHKATDFIKVVDFPDTSNELVLLKINLKEYKNYISSVDTDEDGYILEPEKVFIGVLIDGLYRTQGMCNFNESDIEFPISVYLDLSSREIPRIYSNINEYQEKPSSTRKLIAMTLGGVSSDIDKKSNEYLTQLNNESSSVLHNRIRTQEGKRDKELPLAFISEKSMKTLLMKNIIPKINKYTVLSGVKLLNSYFEAWRDVYPEAWGSKEYVLTKTMGVSLLCRIFPEIFTFAILNEKTHELNKNIFKKYINEIFKDKTINLNNNNFKLDWKSEAFGQYSNGKGINDIFAVMEELVNNYKYEYILNKKTN